MDLGTCYRNSVVKTWFLDVRYVYGGEHFSTYGTGFSFCDPRMVCTAAHIVKAAKEGGACIVGFHLKENNVPRFLEIVLYKPQWDIALLRVCSEDDPPPQSFDVAADYHKLFVGKSLIHIGCGGKLLGSLYKCMIANELPTPDDLDRESYDDQTSSETNKYSHSHTKTFLKKKKLEPLLPIIEVSGLHMLSECEGGPVVDLEGNLTGMLIGGLEGSTIGFAIHGAVLSKAYKQCSENRSQVIKNEAEGPSS